MMENSPPMVGLRFLAVGARWRPAGAGADRQEVLLGDGVTSNPEFGLASALVGAQRQAQLGLRIVF